MIIREHTEDTKSNEFALAGHKEMTKSKRFITPLRFGKTKYNGIYLTAIFFLYSSLS